MPFYFLTLDFVSAKNKYAISKAGIQLVGNVKILFVSILNQVEHMFNYIER